MDVGYEWEVALGGSEFFGDVLECLGCLFVRCGDANDFTANFG